MNPLLNAVSTANRLRWRWLLLLLLLPAFAAHAQAPCPISVPFASGSGPPLGDPGIAQTFTPTCTGKLTTLVVQYGSAADDFRGSGEFVQWSIRDAAGTTVLASVPPTDDIYPGQTRTYDFSAANVVLTAGTQYRWDGRNTRSPGLGAILLNYSALNTNPYAGGQAFVGGTANPTRDFLGWTVNIAATVQTGTISGSPFCAGAAVSVPFTAYGTIGTGNVYTAQLSDASGSFAAPATIGTLSSTATTGTINATLPAGTASGSGYRIRVTASTAGFAAVPNTSDLTITNTPAPTGAASQSFAAGATVANLAATGTAIKWYATTSSTTALPTTTPLTNGTTYYATQTVSGCESQSRLAVTATVAAPANQPPTIANQTRSVAENSANGTNVGTPVTASDPDAGQTLSYAITGGNAAGRFAINSSTGQLTVAGALDFEAVNSYSLTVTVTDNAATPASSSATVTVSVTNVNEAPVAVNDALTVAEDAAATTVNVLANDTDPDAGTTLTVTAVTQPATGGTVTLTSGVVRFTPAANFNGSTSFTYTLSDGALTSTATVAVTVTPVNDPPTATNDALTVNQTAGATVVDVLANDTSAPDTGETLTVTAVTQPATGGTVTLTGGVVRFAPTATFAGTTSFTYTLSDGNGGTATATVAVTVVDTTPPTATLASGTAANGGSSAAASFAYTVTFSESVTGFVLADVSVSNGTATGFTGSGNSYSFSVTPTAAGAVTVSIPANAAQDASGNGNSASTPYTITFAPTATLSASISSRTNVSCNGGATGAATVTASGGTAPYIYQWSNGATTATTTGLVAGTYTVTVTDAANRTASASATITEPSALTSSVAVTNVACFGGSTGAINLTPAGGTAPYTFNWGGGIATEDRTNLAAGTYSVTITDANSCTLVRSVSVSQPATALSVSVSKTDATTNGGANGAATATPAGGTSGYTYQWSNGAQTATITGLTAGTYNVVVTDANGCTTSGSATVGQPAPAPQSLTISTGTSAAPVAIAAGTYNNVTITGTGFAQLSGAVTVNGTLLVQGSLNTNCQALTGSGSFTLAAGATLSICDAAGITATGSTGAVQLTGARSFSPEASYVYNGTAAQATGNGLPAQVLNLTSANASTLTLSQALSIRQVLTLNAGNLATNGQALTLLSDASGTALIANLGNRTQQNEGIVQGNVTVQRYIDGSLNAGPGYRHLAAPVGGATVASFGSGGTTPVVNSAYNTAANPGQVTPFPTVYFYDQARLASSPATTLSAFDKGWQSPAALSDAAPLGFGYTVQLPGTSTLSFTGSVYALPLGFEFSRNNGPTAADAGWNMAGNPYPSPLDLSTITAGQRGNVDAAFYTYESTSQYGGNYRSYVNGIGNPLLGSSQAFFMRVSAGQTSGSLDLTNANRVTTYAQQAPVRRGAADSRPQLQLTLAGQGLSDALTVYAQTGATTGFDQEFDAQKLWNPSGLSLATVAASGEALAIDGRPAFPLGQPVPLTVQAPRAGTYSLTATDLLNLPAGSDVTLVDLSTGTRTPLLAGTRYTVQLPAGTTAGRLQLEVAGRALSTAGQLAQQLSLYPNPTQGQVQLVRPATWGGLQVQVLSSIGQVVLSTRLAAGEQTLSVQHLPVGVYTLRLTTQQGQTLTKRLVRQ